MASDSRYGDTAPRQQMSRRTYAGGQMSRSIHPDTKIKESRHEKSDEPVKQNWFTDNLSHILSWIDLDLGERP